MISVTTAKFRKALDKLPLRIQNKARKTYERWKNNPQHPSLEFKQIHSKERINSVRVGLGYRALGVMKDDTIIWFWIGSHEDYNKLVNNA
jgi:mRNA-degrading endonuclease RelE of RelBE toxin-antitoxin system